MVLYIRNFLSLHAKILTVIKKYSQFDGKQEAEDSALLLVLHAKKIIQHTDALTERRQHIQSGQKVLRILTKPVVLSWETKIP